MEQFEILKVWADKNGEIKVNIPSSDDAVMVLTDYIVAHAAMGDQKPLDVLFAITVHFLARETTGKVVEEYCKNIKKYAEEYGKHYKEAIKEIQKFRS